MKTTATLLAGAALLVLSAPALSDDLPKRKSGLWELKATVSGQQPQTMLVCVEGTLEESAQQAARAEAKKSCSKNEIKREGDRVVINSVCKIGETTATTNAVFYGDFNSAYRADTRITYNPPVMNMSEQKTALEARWLGPCKAGQKPGEMFRPDGTKIEPPAPPPQQQQQQGQPRR